MKNKNIILIGGMPTVGKSYITSALSKKLELPWISGDQIRNIMRVAIGRKHTPDLYSPEGYDVESFHNTFSAKQIVDIEFKQSEAAWSGIVDLIKNDYTWDDGFLIEGVNILPHLVEREFANHPNIKSVFLIDENIARMKKVIYERGLWDDAPNYSDEVKEKEVEWVSLFASRLKEEALKYNQPVISVEKNKDDLEKVIKALDF